MPVPNHIFPLSSMSPHLSLSKPKVDSSPPNHSRSSTPRQLCRGKIEIKQKKERQEKKKSGECDSFRREIRGRASAHPAGQKCNILPIQPLRHHRPQIAHKTTQLRRNKLTTDAAKTRCQGKWFHQVQLIKREFMDARFSLSFFPHRKRSLSDRMDPCTDQQACSRYHCGCNQGQGRNSRGSTKRNWG